MVSRRVAFLALLACLLAAPAVSPRLAAQDPDLNFTRGDANTDGVFDVSDGVRVLVHLFRGVPITCADAADSNDSGGVEISDATYSFQFLFRGGARPPAPFPGCGTDPSADALGCAAFSPCRQGGPEDREEIVHLLNRIGYGPSVGDIAYVEAVGIENYVEEQLDPASIDESGNTALRTREDALFTELVPTEDTRIVAAGELWKYRKGTSAPPAAWKNPGFDDSGADWLLGVTGIGYGDGDDATVLSDMEDGYFSVYLRKTFSVADLGAIDNLVLRVVFDDGFVAYLNGTEVARRNVNGNPPAYNTPAASSGEPTEEFIDISARKNLLVAGGNLLAIQVHNSSLGSSDLSMIPELISREVLPLPSRTVIRGIDELQRLVHVRGVYSQRQLQEVLAEFWENHFTTDFDKVAEYFDALRNSDATDAMSTDQARAEAAQVEYLEYEFLREHALGSFGDLLLYSATSPSMTIYLDNVLNFKASPNENYAREILELFAFGVDNRYVQRDIEQLARCFTGWTVCKVAAEDAPAFPDSARNPPVQCGVQFNDTVLLALGPGWKYFKGTAEPTPDGSGNPTTAWTEVGYDASAWLNGSTGIGYGDGDDATVLSDMRNSYVSVYMRREFIIDDPVNGIENLILNVAYDDGIAVYVNGVAVGRSESMEDAGAIPAYDYTADGHEVTEEVFEVNLNRFRGILRAAPEKNVLAIQAHNTSRDSSDLSVLPRLVDRVILPGSVENGDRNAVWTFRFDPNQHDTGAKVLFQGTPYQMNIPSRTGPAGVLDAINVVDAMVNHPSTKEFICIKLIQKFVSNEISLNAYKFAAASVPLELRELLADAIDAWTGTGGSIEAVMRVILDPAAREGAFWQSKYFRGQVKTPIEFLNSSLRVVDGLAGGAGLPALNDAMGMHLFTRDEPDGWPDYIAPTTGTTLERIEFGRVLAAGSNNNYRWTPNQFVADIDTAGKVDDELAYAVVDYLSEVMYPGALSAAERDLLKDYLRTGDTGNALTLSTSRTDFLSRVQELVGVMLSSPLWQLQ